MDNNAHRDNLNQKAKKAGAWYTVGNLFLKGCVFLSLPLFTRLLSVDDFGVYNTYIAYEAILAGLLGLGFYATLKNAKIKYKDSFEKYVSSVVFLCSLFLLVVLLLCNAFFPLYEKTLGYSRLVVNILILQSFSTALIQMYSCKLNIEFKYKSYLLISALNTLFNIVLSVLFIIFLFPNEKYLGRMLGTAIPVILITIYIIVFCLLRGKKLIDFSFWRFALRLGLPLIPHVISQSILSQFDRIMVTSFCGDYDCGVYSFFYTVCTILAVLATSFDNAWTPWVYYRKSQNMDEEIKTASKSYILFYSLVCLCFVCVIPEALYLLAPNDYLFGKDIIVPLSLSNYFIFMYFLPVNIEYYHSKTLLVSLGTVFACVLNCVLNYLFIPLMGFKAAAYTTMISYFCLLVLHLVISMKYGFSKNYSLMFIILAIFSTSLISFGIMFIDKIQIAGIIVRYSVFCSILIFLFVKRDKFLFKKNENDISK